MYISLNPIRKIKYIYNLVDNSSELITTSSSSTSTSNYYIPEVVRVTWYIR